MATRFKSGSRSNFGQSPLPTGLESQSGLPDLTIPSCGVEDVDTGIFNLFDKEIALEYGGIKGSPISKVPVIFAAGEKWAMLKRGRPIRDRNNSLILPLITIMRTEMNQSTAEDVAGRGTNQQTGEFVVRRRLDRSDRRYQSLINRLLIPNQDNLAAPGDDPQSIASGDQRGKLTSTPAAAAGAYLVNDRTNNVWETIVVPTPQFYTVKYQVTVWTQYTQHANQIIEKIFASLLPQGQCWRIDTPKGYWFVARIEDGSLAMETNFEDMSQQERFIKHNFVVSVPAYFFVSSAPGTPVPIKRYVSSPTISFDTSIDPSEIGSSETDTEYVIGSDDPTLPLDTSRNNRHDQRTIGWRQQKIYPISPIDGPYEPVPEDPANSTLPRGYSVKVVNKSPRGETVYSGAQLGGLEIIVTK